MAEAGIFRSARDTFTLLYTQVSKYNPSSKALSDSFSIIFGVVSTNYAHVLVELTGMTASKKLLQSSKPLFSDSASTTPTGQRRQLVENAIKLYTDSMKSLPLEKHIQPILFSARAYYSLALGEVASALFIQKQDSSMMFAFDHEACKNACEALDSADDLLDQAAQKDLSQFGPLTYNRAACAIVKVRILILAEKATEAIESVEKARFLISTISLCESEKFRTFSNVPESEGLIKKAVDILESLHSEALSLQAFQEALMTRRQASIKKVQAERERRARQEQERVSQELSITEEQQRQIEMIKERSPSLSSVDHYDKNRYVSGASRKRSLRTTISSPKKVKKGMSELSNEFITSDDEVAAFEEFFSSEKGE